MKHATRRRLRSGFVLAAISAVPLLALWGVRRVQRSSNDKTQPKGHGLVAGDESPAERGERHLARVAGQTRARASAAARGESSRMGSWTGGDHSWEPDIPESFHQTTAYPQAPPAREQGESKGRSADRGVRSWRPEPPGSFQQTTAYPKAPPRYEDE